MTPPAGLIDLSSRAKFRLTGPDSERYLNGQVSNRVSLATAELAIMACVCNVKGKLDAIVFITRPADGEGFLIDAPGELRESLQMRLDRYLIADDCELEDVTDEFAIIHTLDDGVHDSPLAAWKAAERFGAPGHDLWVTRDSFPSLVEAAGPLIDESAPEVEDFRIRRGIPRWGAELDPDTLPAEAGLDKTAIDFHKGCYLGQEVISRIQSVGKVTRSPVLMRIDDGDAAVGDPVFPAEADDDTKPAGTITSVTNDRKWALGFVKRDWSGVETKLVTRAADGKVKVGNLEVRNFD
ncbi:MAG: folate-binding protein YgfZ [Verrucomicrobiae bacterium]|nr:folate-binding protein YgfZ [Verrucomicrobiae bacterium]